MIIFPDGVKGLSDTKWAGARGSAHRLVGVDYRSEPGVMKAHQALSKISPNSGVNDINELCKVGLPLSDGSTLWFSSESGKIWREVSDAFAIVGTLTIPGFTFKLTNVSYYGSYDYSAEINIPLDHAFNDDGTIFYVVGNATVSGNSGEIFQYTLSTAYDVTTASYASKTFAGDQQANCIFFKPDGTKFYTAEDNGTTSVIEHNLSTPWDLATASASGSTYDFSTQLNRATAIAFSPDGTRMYLTEVSEGQVYQYTLSTAWDVTSATHTQTFDLLTLSDITQFDAGYGGLHFSEDGKAMIVSSFSPITGVSGGEDIAKFELTTAWDISTAVYRNGYALPSGRDFGVTFYEDADGNQGFVVGEQNNPESAFQYTLSQSKAEPDSAVTVLDAVEFAVPDGPDGDDDDELDDEMTQYVYFFTKNWIIRKPLSDVANLTNLNEANYIAQFTHGDDTYHPARIANGRVFIGDKYAVAQIDEFGVVTLETNLTVREPERITLLEKFDVDLLVCTKTLDMKSRILRWDTESPTWYGEDDVYEGEIHAFLDDDNFTYAIAGDFGQMHYYDGEKLYKKRRVPGDYTPTARCKVNPNATAYFMGVPIFGLSNIEGNPNLQGVYSFGQYDIDYSITLDLSWPISTNEFSGVQIGAVIVRGLNIYVAWKSGTDSGIDKIDWTTKYDGAYIETMVLNGAADRSVLKSHDSALADYVEIPTDTSMTMQYSKNYAAWKNFTTRKDTKLLQIRAKATIPEIAAIQHKYIFNTNNNDSPRIENFHANFKGERTKKTV